LNKIIFFLDDNPKRWTSFISNYFGDFTPIYVKNYKEACEQFLLLLDKDLSDLTVEFRLDHDLCDLDGLCDPYGATKEATGYDFVKFMCSQDAKKLLDLAGKTEAVYIHTYNPAGAKAMFTHMHDLGLFSKIVIQPFVYR